MREHWIVVEDFPHYSVSSWGRVRNDKTGRILRDGPNSGGYLCVTLCDRGFRTQYRVHRLVLETFCPPDDPDLDVNHIDRDKFNNAIWNLEWTTHEANMKHAYETGFRSRVKGSERIRIVETGQEFPSKSSCARAIGVERRSVERCLDGRIDSIFGYTIEYV